MCTGLCGELSSMVMCLLHVAGQAKGVVCLSCLQEAQEHVAHAVAAINQCAARLQSSDKAPFRPATEPAPAYPVCEEKSSAGTDNLPHQEFGVRYWDDADDDADDDYEDADDLSEELSNMPALSATQVTAWSAILTGSKRPRTPTGFTDPGPSKRQAAAVPCMSGEPLVMCSYQSCHEFGLRSAVSASHCILHVCMSSLRDAVCRV